VILVKLQNVAIATKCNTHFFWEGLKVGEEKRKKAMGFYFPPPLAISV